jgi:tetratricopeptide (TPR) repeat protein
MKADEPSSGQTASGGDEAAMLALGAASRAKADRYLDEQTKVAEAQAELLRLQAEDFRRDEPLRQRTLRVNHLSELMKLAFELSLALVVMAVAAAVVSALWNAAHDDGLVIEAFSVPPDMAGRGLTGDVVAARLLDKLSLLQSQTASNRAPSSYANNWGDDIKVEIPDTGVSVGQLYAYMRQWLGDETHIRGDVYRDATGKIAITARVGADPSPTFSGNETDLDRLLQQTAESVYQKTQPYRYAVYLSNRGRSADAEAAYRALIADGSLQDRAWAYVGLSTIYQARGDVEKSAQALRKALAIRPDFVLAYVNLGNEESQLQHDEAGLALERKLTELLQRNVVSDMDPHGVVFADLENEAGLANSLGDFQGQHAANRKAEELPDFAGQIESVRDSDFLTYALLHDKAGYRAAFLDLPKSDDPNVAVNRNANLLAADYALGRWGAMWADVNALNAALAKFGHLGDMFRLRVMAPTMASVLAATGDFAGANAKIAATPLDCDLCVRLRGRIAAAEHRWGAASYWFAMISAREPDVPFADADWGQMLLAKGDLDGAIAKFESANRKGPHFADPLEMWGEALMRQNRSDLALAKFAEADKYAPNWGRLHLKWGEALFYAGQKDDAKTQLAIAATLDLSGAEKSELARLKAV